MVWELKLHLILREPPPATQSHVAGFEGFRILGNAGGPAAPELVRIVEANRSLSSRCYSIGALGYIGPAATNVVPFLLKCLADTNATIRWNTALTLGGIHAQPEVVVPALAKLLDDGDVWVRRDAVNAVGAFGPAAA
jgi:HEAT repeat protein